MSKLIRIDASALTQGSQSKSLADRYQQQWLEKHPNGEIQQLNLSEQALPHIDEAFIHAAYTPEAQRTPQQKQTLALSDRLVGDLKTASTLLISTPMYNFSIPSKLKSYIDLITRVGETFEYTESGPKGLLNVPKTVVIVSSGGDYTQPPLNAMNYVTPYLKTVLGFNGLHEVDIIEAPGMNMGDEKRSQSLQQAEQQIASSLN